MLSMPISGLADVWKKFLFGAGLLMMISTYGLQITNSDVVLVVSIIFVISVIFFLMVGIPLLYRVIKQIREWRKYG